MRILMVTPQLPTAARPGSMAPAARQIQSLRRARCAGGCLRDHGFARA